ncbi:hypothetical protein D3C72_2540250 [compost metagenome]
MQYSLALVIWFCLILLCRIAAIDKVIGASDEGGLVGQEERSQSCHFRGCPQPADRVHAGNCRQRRCVKIA